MPGLLTVSSRSTNTMCRLPGPSDWQGFPLAQSRRADQGCGSDLTDFLIGETLALGEEPATGPAELLTASPTATHGRDIVLLVDPLDGRELRDGGTVSVLAGAPEEADLLRVYPQLLGITDAQPGPDARVQAQLC